MAGAMGVESLSCTKERKGRTISGLYTIVPEESKSAGITTHGFCPKCSLLDRPTCTTLRISIKVLYRESAVILAPPNFISCFCMTKSVRCPKFAACNGVYQGQCGQQSSSQGYKCPFPKKNLAFDQSIIGSSRMTLNGLGGSHRRKYEVFYQIMQRLRGSRRRRDANGVADLLDLEWMSNALTEWKL